MTTKIIPHASGHVPGPGLYSMTAAQYHADPCPEPSLSSSIAKVLISQTPRHAWFAHPRLNPAMQERSASAAMDFGTVVHEVLLGKGGGYTISPYDDFRPKVARAWRDDMISAGKTIIKPDDLDRAKDAAAAIWERIARIDACRMAFVEGEGIAETVLIWREGAVWCRAMLDWWDGAACIHDAKMTGNGLSDYALGRAISGGYDLQAAHYLRGLCVLMPHLAGRFKWRWVFAEMDPPHEVRVIEADGATLTMGEKKRAFALEMWRRCLAADKWPGYPARIERIDYPAFAEAAWLARELADDIAMDARPDLPGKEMPPPTHAIYGEQRMELP